MIVSVKIPVTKGRLLWVSIHIKVQDTEISTDRKQGSSCQGPGMGWEVRGHWVKNREFLLEMMNRLKLAVVKGCAILGIPPNHRTVHWKWVHCTDGMGIISQ